MGILWWAFSVGHPLMGILWWASSGGPAYETGYKGHFAGELIGKESLTKLLSSGKIYIVFLWFALVSSSRLSTLSVNIFTALGKFT